MRKLTLLFALLCASVMGFAEPIDWGSIAYVSGSSQYKAVISPDVPAPGDGIVNVQANAIYVTFPSADFDFSEMTAAGISYSQGGAGIFFNLSNFATVSEMSVTIGNTYNAVKTMYTLTVHNDNPLVVPSTKAPTPATPSQRVRAVYSQYPLNAGMTMLGWSSAMTKTDVIVDGRTFPSFQFGNYLGLGYGPMNVSMMDQIHLDIWTENSFNINFFLISPGTENYYTIELTGGTWNSINIPLSTFTADKTRVTEFKFANASVADQKIFVDNIYFYANDDLPNPDPSEVEDTNFALRTNGSVAYASTIHGENYPARAIDGDNGTLWESVWDNDPQWMVVDLGQRRIFNTVNIFWGNQYAREFYLETSNNGSDWTEIKHVTENTTNHANSEQGFQLDANATARYIRFRGIVRANGYGYTIKEFGTLLAGVPVLTTVGLSSNKEIVKNGEFATLTAEPKDQNNQAIAATLSYSVSPVDAGHVTDGKYYPDKYGLATITVTAEAGGVQVTNNVQIWGVTSDNLALNNALTDVGTYYSGDTQAKAVDGNDESVWQGCTTNTTSANPTDRTYDAWFVIDLKGAYSLQLVTIHFEGACSDAYKLYGSTNNVDWTEIYSYEYPDPQSGNRTWNHTDKISANDMANAGNVRYLKFISTRAASEWGVKIYELQVFGEDAATPTKSVSASANDPAMGTATVKQNDVDVTEVETGTTVTFSATPNDGYIFVNWSNGNTNATFNATVDAAMNLTANFRALGNIYCNTLVHSSNGGQEHDAYVTMKRSGENEYQLIVRSTEALNNFGGTNFYKPNNVHVIDIRNQGVLSNNNHTLTVTFSCDKEPYMTTPLYVTYPNNFEAHFPQLTNIEYSQPCADPEITAIELNRAEATLDMGNTLTLVPTFTPAYMSADITWQTSDADVATVDNGVVTPVAAGPVTITAKVTEDIKATCAVTVQNAASHNWYGYGTSQDLDYTYRIEYTTDHHIVAHVKRQGYIVGLVAASMEINKNNVWTTINVTEGEEEGWAKGTTTLTYTAGDNVHILIQSASSGPLSKIEFDYEVGSDNVMPTIVPSTLALSNTSLTMGLSDADVQLTAEIHHRDAANKTIAWTSDDESVVTVVDGLVHPVGVGTTTVHAATFNDISATCEVTVVGALEPTIFWGSGESDGISILYSITRNADHTLTYAVEALHNKVGFVVRVNDGDYHDATLNEGVYTWSSTATYTDGDAFNGFFYMPFEVGAGRVDFHYVVGSESTKGNMPIRLYEDQDNSFMITESDGLIRDVKVTRSFAAGNLYTLVLPFNVDAAQTAAKLPGHLTKLQNTIVKENEDLRINFVDADAIEAGVPYLYEPSAAVANPTFESVEVSAALNPTVADSHAEYHGIYAPMDGNALHALTNAYVLGPDQYLYAVSDLPENQTMAALRAYFVLNFPSAAPGAPKRLAKVVFNYEETEILTGIENTIDDEQNTKILRDGQLLIIREGKTYNAQGQLIK